MLYSTLAILEPGWWPCQIQVLSQKITGGAPGWARQVRRCPPKIAHLGAPKQPFLAQNGPKAHSKQTNEGKHSIRRLVLHRTNLGTDNVIVCPGYVAGKGFNETASALIGELYRCSTGAVHLFIHTDRCCSEFLNWVFCNLFDKLVQWRCFHRIIWCVFINGHSCNLCDAASRAMDRALHNVDYCYGLTDMAGWPNNLARYSKQTEVCTKTPHFEAQQF